MLPMGQIRETGWGHRHVSGLSPREREVLALVAQGASNAAIATELWLSVRTVECHIARVFDKLGLLPSEAEHRRVLAAVAYVRWLDWMGLDGPLAERRRDRIAA